MNFLKKVVAASAVTFGAAVLMSVAAGAYHVEFSHYDHEGDTAYVGIVPDAGENSVGSDYYYTYYPCTTVSSPDCSTGTDGSATSPEITFEDSTGASHTIPVGTTGNIVIPGEHQWNTQDYQLSDDPDYPPPTCTQRGYVIAKCWNCDATGRIEINPLGHDPERQDIFSEDNSRCTLDYTCKRQGCDYHAWLTVNTVKEVLEDGSIKYTANYLDYENLDPDNHMIGEIFLVLIRTPAVKIVRPETDPDPDPDPDPVRPFYEKPEYIPSTATPVETTTPEPTEEPEETTAPEVTEEPEITTVPEIVPETTTTAEEVNIPVDRADSNPHTGAALGSVTLLMLAGSAMLVSKKRK